MAQRPVLGARLLQDVLPEGVVGAALRRRAVEVAAPGVGGEGVAVPLLDRIRRIGQHHVELQQPVALDELRLGERVAALDVEVLDAVEEAVHPGDGGGHEVPLLAVEPDVAPFLALPAQMGDAGEQHAAGAAGGVVDGLARLRLEHLGHQVDDGAVGVELGGGVAGVVGELLDQVLVALAQLVLGQVGDGEFERGEVLDQVAQHGVGQAVLVGPLRVAEDAVELVRVGGLDGPHGRLEALRRRSWLTLRTSRQWASVGIWKRWFSGKAAKSLSPPDSASAACVSSSNTSQSRL